MRHASVIILIGAASLLASCESGPSIGQSAFLRMTENADRVVVNNVIDENNRRRILETTTLEEVARWRKAFEILPDDHVQKGVFSTRFRENCDCPGDYEFSFSKAGQSRLTFTLHHMHHIRTPQIYDGYDVSLSLAAGQKLASLIKALERPQ